MTERPWDAVDRWNQSTALLYPTRFFEIYLDLMRQSASHGYGEGPKLSRDQAALYPALYDIIWDVSSDAEFSEALTFMRTGLEMCTVEDRADFCIGPFDNFTFLRVRTPDDTLKFATAILEDHNLRWVLSRDLIRVSVDDLPERIAAKLAPYLPPAP